MKENNYNKGVFKYTINKIFIIPILVCLIVLGLSGSITYKASGTNLVVKQFSFEILEDGTFIGDIDSFVNDIRLNGNYDANAYKLNVLPINTVINVVSLYYDTNDQPDVIIFGGDFSTNDFDYDFSYEKAISGGATFPMNETLTYYVDSQFEEQEPYREFVIEAIFNNGQLNYLQGDYETLILMAQFYPIEFYNEDAPDQIKLRLNGVEILRYDWGGYLDKRSYGESVRFEFMTTEYWYYDLEITGAGYRNLDTNNDNPLSNLNGAFLEVRYQVSGINLEWYNRGYELGYASGQLNPPDLIRQEWIQIGWRDGYERGFRVGYNGGYAYGLEEGSRTGYDRGYNTGYQEGLNADNQDAYQRGYLAGQNEGFASNLHTWIVPAIIVVILLGGYYTLRKRKQDQ